MTVRAGTAFAKATETLDDVQSAVEIDKHLSDLEAERAPMAWPSARACFIPVTVARIAAWAKGLEGRGFVLVPISAIVNPPSK